MSLNELRPPPLAQDGASYEILRAWAGNHLPQQCVLQTFWEDPATWGLLLVDIARHAARAYADAGVLSEHEAFERIMLGFTAERSVSTDSPKRIRG